MAKDQYVELAPNELEAVAIESKRTIDIEQFVPRTQIDDLYLRDPYYVAPDGEVGQQAFAVIRDAIRKEGMVALGKVVFTSREHIIALEARDQGMLGVTLRHPYEVRDQAEYFEGIKDEKIPKDMLNLALHIVETKRGDFNPEAFQDDHQPTRVASNDNVSSPITTPAAPPSNPMIAPGLTPPPATPKRP